VLLAALCAWASPAAALDRAKAIEVAKKEAGERCAGDAACTFTAKVEEGKWHCARRLSEGHVGQVEDEFSRPYDLIINQTGKDRRPRGRKVSPSSSSTGCYLWRGSSASRKPVAEQVERKYEQEDRHTRPDRHPRGLVDVVARGR
jgi:hypothetical protein